MRRRPLVSAHRDPILSLLARMEQGPVSQLHQLEVGLFHLILLSREKNLMISDFFLFFTLFAHVI